ncbi:NXPE family member 3-like [Glandiceps talaboti]
MKTYCKLLVILMAATVIILIKEIGLSTDLTKKRTASVQQSSRPDMIMSPSTTKPSHQRESGLPTDVYEIVTFRPDDRDYIMDKPVSTHNFTNPNMTRFKLSRNDTIYEGQIFIVNIETFNSWGVQKTTGGDLWFAAMYDIDHKMNTAGHVIDHQNGTYSVYFYAAWPGIAHIDITLVYTSQAIKWLYNLWNIPNRIVWKGIYSQNTNDSNSYSEARCQIGKMPTQRGESKCGYNHESALGDIGFVCETSSNCDELAMTQGNITWLNEKAELLVGENNEYFKSEYLMQRIENGPTFIQIKANRGRKNYEDFLRPCTPECKRPIVSGYWIDDTWQSLICKLHRWEKQPMRDVKECLSHKDMYFLGDSTTRQFSNVVVELVGMGGLLRKRHAARTYRRVEDEEYNISFTFQHHPWAVGGSPYPIGEVKFESEVIDSLQNSQCNYVILVGPYAHYTSWTRDNYIKRLRLLRESLVRFKQRCPDAKVFIKGSKPRDHAVFISYIHSNDFFLYEMNKLMKQIFDGLGAIFLDVWDMNLSYPAPNNIHMPMEVIRQEANLFLSYICKL